MNPALVILLGIVVIVVTLAVLYGIGKLFNHVFDKDEADVFMNIMFGMMFIMLFGLFLLIAYGAGMAVIQFFSQPSSA